MVFQRRKADSEQATGIYIHSTEVAAICSLKYIAPICKPVSSLSFYEKMKTSENIVFELISHCIQFSLSLLSPCYQFHPKQTLICIHAQK